MTLSTTPDRSKITRRHAIVLIFYYKFINY